MSSCTFNSPLSEEELYRAVVGDADQPILDHLAKCAYCAKNLQQIEETEMFINQMLHPRADQLLNYQENLLPAQEWQRVATHVQGCDVCQEQLKAFDTMREADDGLSHEEPVVPPAPIKKQQPPLVSRKPGNPIYASFLRPAAASQSLRTLGTGTASASRRMQFKANSINISIVIKPEAEGIKLEGSLSGSNEGWQDSIVTFIHEDGETITTLGKQWKFSFGSVPAGSAEITILSVELGRSLVISSIEI